MFKSLFLVIFFFIYIHPLMKNLCQKIAPLCLIHVKILGVYIHSESALRKIVEDQHLACCRYI